jgi:MFS family permease
MAYPHHLHYQEQYQLFLFDNTYLWEVVKLPGGVADLLGRFCTQFFLFAWVGAFIIALLLSGVQLLTLRLASAFTSKAAEPSKWWLYGLSFVPAFLLWLFLLDENALLGGVWAVLLTLLASWVYNWLSDGWMRRILLIAAIPILYWMVGPVCMLFLLLQAIGANEANGTNGTHEAHKAHWATAWYYGIFVLLAIMLVMLSFYLPVPASRLWTGIHYHRYPTVIPVLLWAAVLSVFVLALLARVFHKWANASSRSIVPLLSFALVAIVMGCLVWKNSNFKAEKVMQYDFMARHQQWNRILETIYAEKPNNQIGVTVQNLALAMHGMLADHLFEYNQNGILGLLPDVERDATSPLPTAEAFYQLGMIHVAQRTVFEAQEAILDFQKSGRCYKRLAQTNLIIGSYEVARKYLLALQKTLFYREWANETLLLLGNEEAIAKHPEYGRLRKTAYNKDFYFSDHVSPDMLETLFFSNTDNRLAFEYLKAYYMLTGNRDSYAKLLLYLQNQ